MNRARIFSTAILAAGIALSAHGASQSASSVTAAGGGVVANGAPYRTVTLASLRFGMGFFIAANGTATGDLESTFSGTSAVGAPQTITVVGKATAGSAKVGGPANLSGTCSVDMGDGTPVASGVPFALTLAKGAGGKWTLLMVLSGTNLPLGTVNTGSITVR
jgi:hypothetical protein